MEALLQHLQGQMEVVMGQMERATADIEALRRESGMATNGLATVANRVAAVEFEITRMNATGGSKKKDIGFVDVKTMKPPTFTKESDNFQSWSNKGQELPGRQCRRHQASP